MAVLSSSTASVYAVADLREDHEPQHPVIAAVREVLRNEPRFYGLTVNKLWL